jgi:hypothetical protein
MPAEAVRVLDTYRYSIIESRCRLSVPMDSFIFGLRSDNNCSSLFTAPAWSVSMGSTFGREKKIGGEGNLSGRFAARMSSSFTVRRTLIPVKRGLTRLRLTIRFPHSAADVIISPLKNSHEMLTSKKMYIKEGGYSMIDRHTFFLRTTPRRRLSCPHPKILCIY